MGSHNFVVAGKEFLGVYNVWGIFMKIGTKTFNSFFPYFHIKVSFIHIA